MSGGDLPVSHPGCRAAAASYRRCCRGVSQPCQPQPQPSVIQRRGGGRETHKCALQVTLGGGETTDRPTADAHESSTAGGTAAAAASAAAAWTADAEPAAVVASAAAAASL